MSKRWIVAVWVMVLAVAVSPWGGRAAEEKKATPAEKITVAVFRLGEAVVEEPMGEEIPFPLFSDTGVALKDEPATPFRVPSGVRLVRIDAETGLLAGPGTDAAILEAYMPGTEPTATSTALRMAPLENGEAPAPGPLPPRGVPPAGGLY